MSSLVPYVEGAGHWYTLDGAPRFDAGLRDARKERLLPSSTTILKILAKDSLTNWKIEQAILASLTLPRFLDETDQDFAKRVARDAERSTSSAAEFGTCVHAEVERFNQTGQVEGGDRRFVGWLESYANWYADNVAEVMACELRLADGRLGYAGTIDLLFKDRDGVLVVGDIKTQNVKPGKKATTYETWLFQLASYARLYDAKRHMLPQRYVSIILNSNKPDPVVAKWWDEDQQDLGWRGFRAAQDLWCCVKNYDPRVKEADAETS